MLGLMAGGGQFDTNSYAGKNNPTQLSFSSEDYNQIRQELDADDEAKELNKDMKEKRDALKKILLERASLCGIVADKDYAEVSQ